MVQLLKSKSNILQHGVLFLFKDPRFGRDFKWRPAKYLKPSVCNTPRKVSEPWKTSFKAVCPLKDSKWPSPKIGTDKNKLKHLKRPFIRKAKKHSNKSPKVHQKNNIKNQVVGHLPLGSFKQSIPLPSPGCCSRES